MRIDKLTTKFQEALADAQSLAVGNDNHYIEPATCWRRCSRRRTAGALAAAARRRATCRRCKPRSTTRSTACRKSQGTGGEVQVGRDLAGLLNLRRQGSAEARRPVHRERDVPARAGRRQGRSRPPRASEHGLTRKALEAAIDAVRGGAQRRHRRTPKASARRSRNTPST